MGTLIIWAVISAFAGMFSFVFSLEGNGDNGFFVTVAVVINVVTVIRMIHEKIKLEAKRFRTSQIIYVVSVAVVTISWIILLLTGGLVEHNPTVNTFLAPLFIGYMVMVWDVIFFIGGTYLTCFKNSRKKPYESTLDSFFLSQGESRNIKKHLRTVFGWIGAISIVVAVSLFVIGINDSNNYVPRYRYSDCYICDNVGRYVQNGKLVTCAACGGSGSIAHKLSNDSNDIMSIAALLFGAIGVGSIVMVKVLKDKE